MPYPRHKLRSPAAKHKKRAGYWMKLYYLDCVLGCESRPWRERVYGAKPKKMWQRVQYDEYMCGGHY